jgi:hypothetical protein
MDDREADDFLKKKFGDGFVLPRERDDNQLAEDVANLTALSRAEDGEESLEFAKEVLGGVNYDFELELEALHMEAARRGMNLTDADDEGQERIDEWRQKRKKFQKVKPGDTQGQR